ncbi:MAG: META domain-containing protein [bacterium]
MKVGNLARICTVVAAATLLGAMAACSNGNDDDGGAAARLTGSHWELVDVAGVPAISQVRATLDFPKPGELSGNNSCNHFGGKYKTSGTGFEVSGVMQTLIGCEPAIAAQEMRYMQALGEAERFAVDGEDLLIYCTGFEEPLRFRPVR